ncbi:unnamed protein product [Prunus armeniaca]|uniref:Uncharacterized protein n=1 Tax=Prunus armeniaca TaxID=36596 RepID=A0A6J5V0G7_PRUAR|nr:unnamed protein product [Prunus armeniaca]CAB4310001.1 unnamed protein product [Prunus armeniaca]
MMRGEKERRGEEKRKKEEMMRTKNNLKFHSIAITRVAIRGNVLTSICQAIKAQDFKGVIIKQKEGQFCPSVIENGASVYVMASKPSILLESIEADLQA